MQEIYKKKMEEMKERLAKETKKMQTAEKRRKLELEGYASDLQAMKKKVAFYQKYIMKLKRLVEEDQAEEALQAAAEDEGEEQIEEAEVESPEKEDL